MPNRYVNMSEEEYRDVIAEWHRVNRAFRDTSYVNTAKKTEPPEPNHWRTKEGKYRDR